MQLDPWDGFQKLCTGVLKNVLSRRRVEKDRSAVAIHADKVANIVAINVR